MTKLGSRGGTLELIKTEQGHRLVSRTSGACILPFTIIYAEVDPNGRIAGPRQFSVKSNSAEDVICPQ